MSVTRQSPFLSLMALSLLSGCIGPTRIETAAGEVLINSLESPANCLRTNLGSDNNHREYKCARSAPPHEQFTMSVDIQDGIMTVSASDNALARSFFSDTTWPGYAVRFEVPRSAI